MGRKRGLKLSDGQKADLIHHLKTTKDRREKERLRVILDAACGVFTFEQLAQKHNRSRSAIQIWIDRFVNSGVAGLLKRRTPPGAASPVAQANVQTALIERIKTGQLTTANQIAVWLAATYGIQRTRKSIYYWLDRMGGAETVLRKSKAKGP